MFLQDSSFQLASLCVTELAGLKANSIQGSPRGYCFCPTWATLEIVKWDLESHLAEITGVCFPAVGELPK